MRRRSKKRERLERTSPLSQARALCYLRDGGKCRICGTDSGQRDLDHLTGRHRGRHSAHSLLNLATMCRSCHGSKTRELKARLIRENIQSHPELWEELADDERRWYEEYLDADDKV